MSEPTLLRQWRSIRRLPAAGWIFGRLVGLTVPYAASIRPRVLAIEPGSARVAMPDRRAVRNHLRSIHAVATLNLGELVANMALMSMQPRDGRWIVTGLEAEYLKKARGRLVGECSVAPVDWSAAAELEGEARVVDGAGDVVTRVRMRWKVGPVPA